MCPIVDWHPLQLYRASPRATIYIHHFWEAHLKMAKCLIVFDLSFIIISIIFHILYSMWVPLLTLNLEADRLTDHPTDRRTDVQTDIVTYRSAIAAKMKKINIQKKRIKTIAKQTFYSNKLMNQHKFLCFNKCIYFSWFYKNLSHWNVIWSCFHFS